MSDTWARAWLDGDGNGRTGTATEKTVMNGRTSTDRLPNFTTPFHQPARRICVSCKRRGQSLSDLVEGYE